MNLSQWGPILLGVAGIIGAISAGITGWRGLRQSGRTQTAAGILAERVQALAELEAVVGRLNTEVQRLSDLNDRDRARHARELTEVRRELSEQVTACTRQMRLVTEALDTLSTVVTDEIARAAAITASGLAHEHVADHPDLPTGGPTERNDDDHRATQ